VRRADGNGVRILMAAAFALAALGAGAATSAADSSRNWSGYVATGRAFSGVSGSWSVPTPACLTDNRGFTASALWVGLGGAVRTSKKIEQIGTSSGCNADGSANCFAWYELWPKRMVQLSLDVEPHDRIRASVALHGDAVELEVVDVTTGRRFHRIVDLPRPDTSSAEWIGEAPSLGGTRVILPLARLGRASFTHATATAGGRTAPIKDESWQATPLTLGRRGRPLVVPSDLGREGGSFSLTWTGGQPGP
jgi:peptidase A4-like protein